MYCRNKVLHRSNSWLLILGMTIFIMLITAGCGTSGNDAYHHEEEQNDSGLKYKVTEEDRTITAEEQEFLDKLYISDLEVNGPVYGDEIYSTVTITGKAMPEESIFSVKDLEELIRTSIVNKKMHDLEILQKVDEYYGLDFEKFLELCGADLEKRNIKVVCEDENGEKQTIEYKKLTDGNNTAILAVGNKNGPFGKVQSKENGNIKLITAVNGKVFQEYDVIKITVGKGRVKDPEYCFHNHKPYKDSLDIAFTVEIYQQGAEYLGVIDTFEFTTGELEDFIKDNPSNVVKNFYGTIGNEDAFSYAGVGGWMDHFEGIDFLWLMQEKMGLDSLEGRAELVGRDGEVYNTIEDLSYFDYQGREDSYYILTSDGVKVTGAIPMIACVKNGYPILKEHEHESEAYVAYNRLNQSLAEHGVVTEVGVVKNHNGPFVACFGNLDGYYGGEQVETAGDCVLIRLYIK